MEPFGAVLAEVLSDFEAAASEGLPPDDAVQRLSLAAHHTLLAQTGGQLPRQGAHAYAESVAPPPVAVRSQLDVRY
jgi:hypothetical protein